jgi:hypothetical protein
MKDPSVKDIIYDGLRICIDPQALNSQAIQTLVVAANGNKFIDRINEIKKNCVAIVNHFGKLCLNAQGTNKELNKEEYQMPLEICKYFINNVPEVLIREFS